MKVADNPPLAGLRVFGLAEEVERVRRSDDLVRRGRSARSLVTDGGRRVLIVGLGPGADIATHAVDGAALIQPITGDMELRVDDRAQSLVAGDVAAVAPGAPHSVESRSGCVFLLAIATDGAPPVLF